MTGAGRDTTPTPDRTSFVFYPSAAAQGAGWWPVWRTDAFALVPDHEEMSRRAMRLAAESFPRCGGVIYIRPKARGEGVA